MRVSIIKNDNDRVVASYEINLRGLNYEPSDDEYYAEAWQCAVDDGVVDENDSSEYSFSF